MPVNPKKLEKVASLTNEHYVAGTLFATISIQKKRILENKSNKTREWGFFMPYISEIKSRNKTVIG